MPLRQRLTRTLFLGPGALIAQYFIATILPVADNFDKTRYKYPSIKVLPHKYNDLIIAQEFAKNKDFYIAKQLNFLFYWCIIKVTVKTLKDNAYGT